MSHPYPSDDWRYQEIMLGKLIDGSTVHSRSFHFQYTYSRSGKRNIYMQDADIMQEQA